ncbi:PREDICTED: translation initiation factor eIF-2B subunit epsilon-like isoform X2 [Tarenaya hassleriana]|uniref:translation initiation factor eIF-2B subunit epsilon-like isoform X2 n=1 Tax=Tarenaya hassleriana TaxID=28532 RepID=UPI00053C344F|nr:PREDICTED: translation initiation factor eIF-2B subunit epsilon-like isoform X2 [Tarenaya hassleriana]
MGAQRKGAPRVSEDVELSRQNLQAILLADSFTTKFRPVTLERPKVLLPLVNVPMIDYTLAWLESAGVEEVFVFCCAHSKQVIEYLENSEWYSHPGFLVQTIESHNSISAGDALRFIYDQQTIHGDFVLVSGDTVSNMPLTDLIQEHRERKKKDDKAIMTMVIKQSKPSLLTHQSRLGTDELFMVVDPSTKQLLYYEDKTDQGKGTICIDKSLLMNNPSISLYNDRQDCYIDICSPEVLSLFQDNFDYQHLRRHFVKGVLVDDIMGYKIFTHEIHSSYAARIDNFRSYDTVSKDIIQRWTYPYVPDINFSGYRPIKLGRQGMYRASEAIQSRSAEVGPFTVIGYDSKIGSGAKILNSVIGDRCSIGSNVLIEGSYIWNNVTIEDGCEIRHAIICDGVIIRAGAVLQPGVVLSYKVVIGRNFVVPAYSKISLLQQPTEEDSDEELEYADNSSGTADISSGLTKLNIQTASEAAETDSWTTSELGPGGAGYIWEACEGAHDEEWKHSVAPIPKDKLAEITQATVDDEDMLAQDDGVLPPSGELKSDADSLADNEYSNDDYSIFEKEVEATFLRAVQENVRVEHVILEVNSLRLSFNMETADCTGAVFYSMLKTAMDMPHNAANELKRNAESVITRWKGLIGNYVKQIDEQIEVIMKFEEMCQESAKEFAPLFTQIMHFLYDNDVLEEDAILKWAEEKAGADESDKVFLKQADKFIQWLKEAEEEEDEDDD